MTDIPLIAVVGPTASGKTRLAIDIAKELGGEIVSADSMQIYKYMDIGTAKPTAAEKEECKHHLIDFVMPDAPFSVAEYCALAHKVIADITSRGKIAVMCGGTGLYINSVINDIDFSDGEADGELRRELNEIAAQKGGEYMLKMLAKFDPDSAAALHQNNLRRIIRAIEFYKTTGTTISEHNKRTAAAKSRYKPLMFCIEYPREILYDRINKRVDIMLNDGLIDEVKRLLDMGYSAELNSMQAIGYKEIISYLQGSCTLAEAADMIKQNSRRYAKRQLTWFRRDSRIIMLDSEAAAENAIKIIRKNRTKRLRRTPLRGGQRR